MMTNSAEVWQLLAELVQVQKENEQSQKELKEAQKETDRQIKELGKQIGGLGKKFGSFTEGFALPSMDRILRERFGMETVSPRVRSRRNGEEMEIDVLAYANGERNAVYLVEVKSHPREEAIDQLKRLLQRFPQFFPEHRDKARYGILAAVDLSEDLKHLILGEGLYVARIEDDVFTLDVPENFQPRAW
ncbi:MAG: DUF3782 domain-containing protein [Prochlorotrichaceae cyanobacterium]